MDDVCLSAARLSQFAAFRILLFVKATFCLVGIGATALSLKWTGIKWLVHSNSKILYLFHMFWTLEVSVSYLIVFSFEFFRLSLSYSNPCDYTIPAALGISLRAIPVIGVVTQSFTMCAFAIERTISTVWPYRYEAISKPYIGLGLGAMSVVLGTASVYLLLLRPVEWKDIQITSTVRTRSNQVSYQILMEIYMFVEVITISLFLVSYLINRKYCASRERQALNWKYQVKENRKIIMSLLPCFTTHCILNVLMIIGLYSYSLFHPVLDKISAAFWIEVVSHVQMYSLLMPLIIAIRLKALKKNVVNSHFDVNTYFSQMSREWELHSLLPTRKTLTLRITFDKYVKYLARIHDQLNICKQ